MIFIEMIKFVLEIVVKISWCRKDGERVNESEKRTQFRAVSFSGGDPAAGSPTATLL